MAKRRRKTRRRRKKGFLAFMMLVIVTLIIGVVAFAFGSLINDLVVIFLLFVGVENEILQKLFTVIGGILILMLLGFSFIKIFRDVFL